MKREVWAGGRRKGRVGGVALTIMRLTHQPASRHFRGAFCVLISLGLVSSATLPIPRAYLSTVLATSPPLNPGHSSKPPGEFVEMRYLTDSRTTLVFNIPLAEVVTDYFDQLKSRSKGYASMEYKITGYR